MANAFKKEITAEGVATLTFDLPSEKVNTFNLDVIQELDQHLQGLQKDPSVKVLVIASGKADSFIAGADLHGFAPAFQDAALLDKLIRAGHAVFNRLQQLPFPSVAFIHGACLGGGLECALACSYRVVTDHPKTLLSLPETTLGIIPGWGGTQRLPRLVGLVESLGMILSGRRLNAVKAYKIHLADAVFAWEFKEEKLKEFLTLCQAEGGRKKIEAKRKRPFMPSLLLEGNPIGRKYVFNKARKDVIKKTKGHYPAPLAALELIEKTYTLPLEQGLEIEINTILKLAQNSSKLALNLIQLFFTQEALKKDTGVEEGIKLFPVRAAGVLGAGAMGSGIAWLYSNSNVPVRMKDVSWEAIGKGLGSVYEIYRQNVKDKRLKPFELPLKFQHVSGTIDLSGFNQVDLVIEAATEDLDLKLHILQELEAHIRPDAIIGTNTSSLTLTQMSKALKHPERFVGMHYFNPVNRMPLVEIVKGEHTSQEAVATAVEFCKKTGKTPMVVKDCSGFLVNRIFVNGANEVMWMFQQGVELERLEKVMLDFGMPMSPFLLADEVGNDVSFKVSKAFELAYGPRMQCPNIVEALYTQKLYGKKTKKGFYLYEGENKQPNPAVKKLQESYRSEAPHLSDVEIKDRMILIMINEAARCLEEGVIGSPAYLDMAMVMGIGFPPFRGGLLKYADELGLPYVVAQLKHFEATYGTRFAVAPLLSEMNSSGKTFYA